MYLKRLEIQGFKSFANKTILDFLPPKDGIFSLTAVVGPNGSGKSNITDAIRWVMGETSMKNVRAKKNEDVIFNGSAVKAAMGSAEVSMVLDNAGADFQDETLANFPEITISRRLYRTGENEYLVNGVPARLLDVHLLLARAKFAEHAYSIVGQGMIDRLLTVTPSERKDFFDEASGIKEYQIKQHQADLKLARTKENVNQAETLLAEVEPRLKLLGRQVKKLEKREEVMGELVGTQEKYYSILFNRSKKDSDELKNKLQILNNSYREAFASLEQTQVELAESAKGSSRQEVFEELQGRYQELVREKNDLERQLIIIEGQMQTRYSAAGQQNVGWLENKIRELKSSHSGIKARFEEARRAADSSAERSSLSKKLIEDLSIEHTQQKLKIARLQTQLLHNQSEQSYRDIVGLTAVKAVLQNRERFGKVFGIISELGEVDEEYRLALEVASGNHLSSIVVGDESVASVAIGFLRDNKYGVATFLPLNKIKPRGSFEGTQSLLNEDGVLGKAIDLIRFDPKFENIFSMILGDTIVVKDLQAAKRIGIGRGRMVTLDGDLVEPRGVMRGGYRNRQNRLTFSTKLTLSNDEQLQEMQSALTLENNILVDLEHKIENAKNKTVELTVAAQSSHANVEQITAENLNIEKEIARLDTELSLCGGSPEEHGDQLKKLAHDKEGVARQISASDKAIKQAGERIENFNREEEAKKQRVFALQERMLVEQAKVNAILNERNEHSIEVAKIETKQESLAEEVMNEMKVSIDSIVERVPTKEISPEALASLAADIQKLKYQLSLIGGIDEEVVKEYSETKERYDFLTGQLTDLKTAMIDLDKMIEELDVLMKKRRAAAFKKIRKDFGRYFEILFDGGKADLEEVYGEVEEDDVIGENVIPNEQGDAIAPKKKEKILTGIEVLANPPGKKVKYLSMLSGGERTLTSIALICAILFNNPSPFVVLDEVEAALDEANTMRFAKIMSELARHSQFIVVTHNRVTMHAADALYGVTMGPDGVSKLLSVKMTEPAGLDGGIKK